MKNDTIEELEKKIENTQNEIKNLKKEKNYIVVFELRKSLRNLKIRYQRLLSKIKTR